MSRPNSKYRDLYLELDALEQRFETWFVRTDRYPGEHWVKRFTNSLIRTCGKGKFSMRVVDDGYVFMRLK